ncbi:ty3-gypsy retrotransposon protein [Tanacetum coccineum]
MSSRVDLQLQGLDIKVDLYVLPMQGRTWYLGFNGYKHWSKVILGYPTASKPFGLARRFMALCVSRVLVEKEKGSQRGCLQEPPRRFTMVSSNQTGYSVSGFVRVFDDFKDCYYVGKNYKLKALLLQEFHATPSAGHGGIKKTLVGLSAMFFWKGMRKSVEEFIKKCVVCQQVKNSTEAIGGYLQPLPTPMTIWENVSMDFITGLPPSKGNTVILVVVDRLSKYAHFGVLPTSFNAHKVAEVFLEIMVKHHGIPKTIVFDRDPIFVQLLPWAEYSYNSSYHSSIQMSPFQAVYGRQPLAIIPYPPGSSKVAAVDELLAERDGLLKQLKDSLLSAKNRMEVKANRKRRDVEFNVGDLVLVKLQPYRQITLAKRFSNKLAKRYYGPYKVEARVGKVAYRLALPATSKIHPVFHVSILKPFVGDNSVEVAGLPEELHNDQPLEQPLAVFDARMVLLAYPTFNLKDKVVFEGGGNDTSRDIHQVRKSGHETKAPAWQKDFVIG